MNDQQVKDAMEKAKVTLFALINEDPVTKGWTQEKRVKDNMKVLTKQDGPLMCSLFVAWLPSPKEQLLRVITDINYMKIWDTHLTHAEEVPVEEGIVRRTLTYMNNNLFDHGEMVLNTACMWGTAPPGVFYTSHTLVPEDQIFPDVLEMPMSGFVATDAANSGSEIKFLFQLRLNQPQKKEQQLAFADDLAQWFVNFTNAAALDPSSKKMPSFQMPNRGSMVFDEFDNRSFVHSMDLSSNLPKLPSFSHLNLPQVAPEEHKSTRNFDVVLPLGKTMFDYWSGVFGDLSSPLFVLSAGLDRVEYSNLALQVLLGVGSDVSSSILGAKGSLDVTLLESAMASIVSNRKSFFVFFFTLHVGGANPAIVVAEGNCTGCWTAAGWFLVVELRPIFVKRVGLLQIKNNLLEQPRFECFHANSPLPVALILTSGIVLAANSSFCLFVDADLRSGVVGEHLSSVLGQHKSVVGDVLLGMVALAKSFGQLDQPKSIVLENNQATLVSLSFFRGSALHNDSLRVFLLTFLSPDAVPKRRRRSSIKI